MNRRGFFGRLLGTVGGLLGLGVAAAQPERLRGIPEYMVMYDEDCITLGGDNSVWFVNGVWHGPGRRITIQGPIVGDKVNWFMSSKTDPDDWDYSI